jgi:hypothetical protein
VLLLLSALSIIARLAALLAVGNAAAVPLTWVLRFIGDHQRSLLALSIVVGAVQTVRIVRRLRRPATTLSVDLVGRAAAGQAGAPPGQSDEAATPSKV